MTAHRSLRRILAATAALVAISLAPVTPTAAAEPAPADAATAAPAPPAATAASSIGGLRQIVAGNGYTCGIDDEAFTAHCWGTGGEGQLGTGDTNGRSLPTPVAVDGTPLDGEKIVQIDTGGNHTCALTADDVIACWGLNAFGQLGTGTTTQSLVPIAVATAGTPLDGKDIIEISAGTSATCALTKAGAVACWGRNASGNLGDGSTTDRWVPTAVEVAGGPLDGEAATSISTAGFTTCATTTSGVPACWGANGLGAVGTGSFGGNLTTPQKVSVAGGPLDGTSAQVLVGSSRACGRLVGGTPACWGGNDRGELGDGTTTDRAVPTALDVAGSPLDGVPVDDLGLSYNHACALAGGAIACWGQGTFGQLGDGANVDRWSPVAVATAGTPLAGATILEVTAGASHSCALHADGQATCWGSNHTGALGNGETTATPQPPTAVELDPQPPGAPTGVTAANASTPGTVDVSWNAPASDFPITLYQATAYRDGATTPQVTVTNLALSTEFWDLEPGSSYRFAVRAQSIAGWGPVSALSAPVVIPFPPEVPAGASYVPITPCRIVDTRQAGGTLANREIRDFQVRGEGGRFAAQGGQADGCEVPLDAVAVEASVTAVGPADSGFFRAWPADESMPNATFMNFDRGMDITNTGALTLSASLPAAVEANALGDDLRVRNFGGAAHYVIDLQGYYVAETRSEGATTSAVVDAPANYQAATPCRIVDTRQAGGTLANREIRDLQVTGAGAAFAAQGGTAGGCGIPLDAVAVEVSVTAVDPADSGFFRAWPGGVSMPNATFMNFDRGMDITNTGSITIDPDRAGDQLRIRNFGGASHYVLDVQGWYTVSGAAGGAETAMASGPTTYQAISPCRIVDTRQAGGRLANREIRDITVVGGGGAFADQGGKSGGCDIPGDAIAIEASITAVDPADSGFFRAWPAGQSMPNATFMNFDRAMDITNTGSITIEPGADQHLRIRNFGGASHYVIDIQGYWAGTELIPM